MLSLEIRGGFYKILKQDVETGVVRFTISPYFVYKETRDGLILCEGRLAMYQKDTPLLLKGEFKDGVFQVDTATCKDESLCERLIHFICKPPTTTRKKIAEFVKFDIYKYCSKKGALEDIEKAIPLKNGWLKFFHKVQQLNELEEFTKFLYSYEISLDQIELLIAKDVTLGSLKRNPYHILRFSEIPFERMDRLAMDQQFLPYCKERISSIVLYAMRNRLRSGHTAVTKEGLYRNVKYLLDKSARPIQFGLLLYEYALESLAKELRLVSVGGNIYVQLKKIYEEESTIAAHINRLSNGKELIKGEIDVDRIEKEQGLQYTKGQRAAFELLKTSGVKILTGRPGAGKTAVIKGLISEFLRDNKRKVVQLSATTGRAAQVMGAACGDEAKTVHKMLDIRPFSAKGGEDSLTGKGENNPILADLVIVDEFSMEGVEICSILLSAIKNEAIILLVGDDSQLQSVEYGNVLQDFIESGVIPVYRLTEVMRQKGRIPDNAWKANHGSDALEIGDDFKIYEFQKEEDALPVLMENIRLDKSKVLCSVKNGALGVHTINKKLQESTLRDRDELLSYGQSKYYKGDYIIITKTDYELGVYNGDIGTIEDYDPSNNRITLLFTDTKGKTKTVFIDRSQMKLIILAYAITTHKSQGSEWDDIHVLLPDTSQNMLTRRLFYTAITRARSRVFIYSINESYKIAIRNCNEEKRVSILKDRLQGSVFLAA